MEYIEEESELVRKLFNIEEAIAFTNEHDVQIIRGADFQYECWIDKKCYTVAFTALGALAIGMEIYKQRK